MNKFVLNYICPLIKLLRQKNVLVWKGSVVCAEIVSVFFLDNTDINILRHLAVPPNFRVS